MVGNNITVFVSCHVDIADIGSFLCLLYRQKTVDERDGE